MAASAMVSLSLALTAAFLWSEDCCVAATTIPSSTATSATTRRNRFLDRGCRATGKNLQVVAGPSRLGDGYLTIGMKGAIAASGRDHDRVVIGRAEKLGRRIDHTHIDEPAGVELEFQKSLAIGTQRHVVIHTVAM